MKLTPLSWCIFVCLLGGCSQTEDRIYAFGLFGQKTVGNETYVTIDNVWNEMDALPLAEKHCRGFGRAARFSRMEGHRAIYDCVKL